MTDFIRYTTRDSSTVRTWGAFRVTVREAVIDEARRLSEDSAVTAVWVEGPEGFITANLKGRYS